MGVKRVVPRTKAEAEALDDSPKMHRNKVLLIDGLPDLGDGIQGSPQQDAIWREMITGKDHLVVNAYAGTGKTFTMVRGLSALAAAGVLPRYVNVAAFNRAIGKELKEKVPTGVRAGTLHAFGLGALTYRNPDLKIEADKMDILLSDIMGEKLSRADREAYYHILRLSSLCKNTLKGVVSETDEGWTYDCDDDVLDALCTRYDVNVDRPAFVFPKVIELIEASLNDEEYIDQDDMIWLPVVKMLRVFQVDLLIVDEFQDLNACQHALILMLGRRIMAVGDRYQGIYGFRGADVHSMQNMIKLLNEKTPRSVVELPLSLTRRCPKKHVAYVKKTCPWLKEFDALPDAPEGVLGPRSYAELVNDSKLGDMVVCRTNAPNVRLAFEFIRQRKRVKIQGRDIGLKFQKMVEFHAHNSNNIDVLRKNFAKWVSEQMVKANRIKGFAKKERRIAELRDTARSMQFFMDNSKTVKDIIQTIIELFSESSTRDYVLLGTAHALKGMEAETVWILGPEEMPHYMAKTEEDIEQEWNLWYVAHTRSKANLFLVTLPESEVVGREFLEQ